jgi:hypothetical protein
MGLFDRTSGLGMQRPASAREAVDSDDQAIARYRYMLRTAPPETIEQAHAEAFAKLTPEQRRKVLDELATAAPEGERNAVLRAGDAPGALAQAATRAEIREPGIIERMFGRAAPAGAAPASGFGTFVGPALLGSLAGTVLGSMVAQHFLNAHPPSAQTLADLSGTDTSVDGQGNDLAQDASSDSIDDFRSDDGLADADDAGFDDGSDFDFGDTFDV